jgi:hypothetical protein
VLRITQEHLMMRLTGENIHVSPIMQTIAIVPDRKKMAKVRCAGAIEAKAAATAVAEKSAIAAGPTSTS